jgi:hypothetical protein
VTAAPAPDPGVTELPDGATGSAVRPPLLLLAGGCALVAVVLALAALPSGYALAAAVLVLQVVLVLGFLALVDAPAASGTFLIAVAAAAAADALALADDGRVGDLAGVVALGLIASLLHQLVRHPRNRVTEALADTLVAVVLVVCAACLVALRADDGGEDVALVALATAGTVLLVGRLVDRFAPRPVLTDGTVRGWPGLLVGLAAGVAAALVTAGLVADGTELADRAALLGLLVAACVAATDLAVDLSAAELRSGRLDRRKVDALRPVGLLLPFAALGPVALLAGRLVLS